MKHSYTPFLAIFLIFIIIGFSYYKQYESSHEGMTNIDPINRPIITRGNRKVRRRRIIKESLKPSGFVKFFKNVGKAFRALFSNIICGFKKIVSLPSCMQWYMLQVFGKIVYTICPTIIPMFFVSLGSKKAYRSLKAMEKTVWDNLENLDRTIYKNAGFHIIHYSDEIVNKCYKCKGLVSFPKF